MTDEIKIVRIQNPDKKSVYTGAILEKLPEWFGNQQAVAEYAEKVREYPYWAAMDYRGECIGFFVIKTHYQYTGEILVCGVLPEYHHKGIGKMLYHAAKQYLMEIGVKYLIVKTLSDTVDFAPYARTREFYESIGFVPLVTLTEMWDEENPCLIMLKLLG